MKRIKDLIILSTVSAVLSTGFAFAQDRDDHRDDHRDGYAQDRDHRDADHRDADRRDTDRDRDHDHYVRHDEWKKGYHMRHEDWERARRVDDWRTYRLEAPPRGYEWRYVDGYYVLAAVDTGIIASIVAANAAHY